jgi:hypothetical protein
MRTKRSLAVPVCIASMVCSVAAGQGNRRERLETSNLTLKIQPEKEDSTNFTIWRWPVAGSDIESLVPPDARNRWFGFEWKGPWSMVLDGFCVVGQDGTQVTIGVFDEVRGVPVGASAVASKGYKTNWSDCRPSPSVSAAVSTTASLKLGTTDGKLVRLFGEPESRSGDSLVWRWPWRCGHELDYEGEEYRVKSGRLSVHLDRDKKVVYFEVSGADEVQPEYVGPRQFPPPG